MKKFLPSLLVMILCTTVLCAQTLRPIKPKKDKGNLSNGRTELGFSSPTSVLYSSPVGSEAEAAATSPNVSGANKGTTVSGCALMTPSGWGSTETFAFVTAGGTPVQPYGGKENPDFLSQVGFGTGDYRKFVSVVGILNINDVSKLDNLSATFIVSRKIGKTSSISAGAVHLFADAYKTDMGPSYYVAYSQIIPKTRFNYTVGVGSGRFYDNSEYDKEAGKKEHGTGLFGSISYDITRYASVSTEWTGVNLCVSSSIRFKPKWPVLSFGLTDITRLSGDKPSFYFSLGEALVFSKGKR